MESIFFSKPKGGQQSCPKDAYLRNAKGNMKRLKLTLTNRDNSINA